MVLKRMVKSRLTEAFPDRRIRPWKRCNVYSLKFNYNYSCVIGSLCQDILRVFKHFQALKSANVSLVEVSPVLSDLQARKLCVQTVLFEDPNNPVYREGTSVAHRVPIKWYRDLKLVPRMFTLLIAHEFFDALPIHKFRKTNFGYREVLIDIDKGADMNFR